ncbi:MAG TPA: DeoR family transcriptional regulator [Gammaproteobacteria bacterium]|nr:DeoR family transcriptional regulator [Gammaproteobacteria bacterium]
MTTKQAPDSRRLIMQFIKRQGHATAGEVAAHLGITREGARQQLQALETEGWIARGPRSMADTPGRPAVSFQITPAGDHTFAKNYDALSLTLVDAVADQLGPEALVKLLASISDQQVRQWEPKLAGLDLPARIKALKGIYFEEDPHTSVRKDQKGYALVERNCPYLNVAMTRPQLCSVTVNTLTRLLGVKVVREERFQDDDKRCVFRVLDDQPVELASYRFTLEELQAHAA